jgi:hypothetical protein
MSTRTPWHYFPATNYEGFAIAPLGLLPTLAAVQSGCRMSDGSRSHVVTVECFNFPGETEEIAALIVRAVNNHETLLSVARKCEALLTRQGWRDDSTDPKSVLLREAREAIALAKPIINNEFTLNPPRRIDGEIDEYLK